MRELRRRNEELEREKEESEKDRDQLRAKLAQAQVFQAPRWAVCTATV